MTTNLSTGLLSSVLSTPGLGDLLSLLVRMTLIAATGVLLCSALRTASAAKRYLVAMATLVALIAFPVARVALPTMPLPILPAAPASALRAPEPLASRGSVAGAFVPEPRVADATTVASSAPFAADRVVRFLPVGSILLALAVSVALLFQVLVSFLAAAVTAHRARRIDDAGLRQEVEYACRRLGVSRAVDIRESASITIPVVWGLFRPVLLLPVGAREWSRERLRVVFLHEVAHVARHDGFGLLLTRFATAVFWFHPLVWELARVARRECERCCDDLVLSTGERATEYASHLLAIVRSATGQARHAGVAAALAQRSNLEGRLVSILRPGQRRDSVSRSRLFVTIGLAALLLGATAAIQVVPAPAKDEPSASLEPTNDGLLLASSDALKALAAAAAKPARWRVEAVDPYEVPNLPDVEASPDVEVSADVAAAADVETAPDAEACPPSVESVAQVAALEAVSVPSITYSVAGKLSKLAKKDKGNDGNQQGIELMRAGRYAQAIDAFQQEIRESGSVNAMYNLACAYSLRGDKQRAFGALEQAVENGFDNTSHMSEDEDLRLLQGDPHFYQLIRLARDLQLFGNGRFGNGRNDESDWRRELPRLERVTREHGTIGRAWSNLGYARLEAGDPKGGMAAYQRALDLGYQKPLTLYNLACCASRSGAIDDAFRLLDRADQAGFEIGEHVGSDTDLDALRGDPRYDAMLDRWDKKMAKEYREKQKEEDRQKSD